MIHFLLNDRLIKTNVSRGITLLDFIREHQQLKGTKIGCREGDCGACTALVGTADGDNVDYQSITSCISPLGNAHGKHIVTIEGINLNDDLNIVQQAMSDNYATQCGFCTPGFIVSMTGYALRNVGSSVGNHSCNDAISGNICRCTGYKSIEKAGKVIEEKLHVKGSQYSLDRLIKEGYIPEYFKDIPNRLKLLLEDISIEQGAKKIHSNHIKVANGTDLYVRHADKLADEEIELLAAKDHLKGISFSEGVCTLGAYTTVTEMAENKKLQSLIPRLRKFLKLVSSEQIRNMGTLGGNFVNASPIGDMTIFFLALDSTLSIIKKDGSERRIPFQTFHQGYKKYDLKEDELVKSISFQVPQANEFFNFEKVSKRTHLDIASVNGAGKISVVDGIITQAHFSVGGVSAIPKYLSKTNAFLIKKALNPITIKKAATILDSEISPISDVRGDTEYKRLLAKQLFFAHFVELFPTHINLRNLIDS